MQLEFILVEPVVPENVGAAARAIKTMGFSRLNLVRSDLHHQEPARWLAHGAGDVLQQARSFSDLDQALADVDLAVATSAKPRHGRRTCLTPADLRALIERKGATVGRVALVFGREDRGLANDEIARCDLVTAIPLAAPYPSLNLAQAVMLYAWELSDLKGVTSHSAGDSGAGKDELEHQYRALRQRVATLLNRLDRVPDSKLYHWALERLAFLEEKDIHFLHTLCQSLERALADRAGG